MAEYVYFHPTNPKLRYRTALVNDPNIPANWVLDSGRDGAQDEETVSYIAGVNSGGFPKYVGDPTQRADWPNGILGGYAGGKINNP